MKRSDWIFLISIVLYNILFWKEMPGLNFLIFTTSLLTGQVLLDPRILRIGHWWLAAIGAMCSSFCVFYYGSPLCVFATFASLLMSSYFVLAQKGSVFIAGISSMISIFAAVGFMITRLIERRGERNQAGGSRLWKRTLIVACALIVALVFFFLYRDSSILFLKLTEKINFDWISFGWICFSIVGALIVYGFYYHNSIPGIVEWDNKQPHQLDPSKANKMDKLMSIDSERFSGIVLFSLLNFMLLIVNGLDLAFIFGGTAQIPDGVTRMEYVHQGVGTLILSIIFAMLIILFYFRGRMNFATNGKVLRLLALVWIAQNAFMLFSTAWRNQLYVVELGLTYKRIGVYFYLLLTLIGLIVTAWKVVGKKTNIFLVRMNSWLFYAVLVGACFVNWDGLIIHNNLNTGRKPDLVYLNSLSADVLPELVDYTTIHAQEITAAGLKLGLPSRVYLFLLEQKYLRTKNKWPSYVFKADQSYRKLKDRSSIGKSGRLVLTGREVKEIYYFKGFENITVLDAADNDLETIGEAAKFPNLTILVLDNNPMLTSIAGIEKATKLEELRINVTNVQDFSPLLQLRNLKHLYVDRMPVDLQEKLKAVNPGLQITVYYN
jgi:hypothetical protein